MPTIDQLIVTLVLDATGFAKAQKDATAAAQKGAADITDAATKAEKAQTQSHTKIASSVEKLAADIVGSNAKAAESFTKAMRAGLTFFAVLSGTKSIMDFAQQIIGLDASIGRLAHNLGSTPEALSSIGRAAERMGGTFDGAVSGLRGLSDAFQELRTTGNTSIMEPLARLQALGGKPITFGKDVRANLNSISADLYALDQKDPRQADYLGRQILHDETLANLAKLGPEKMNAEFDKSAKISPADVKMAQDFQAAWVGLRQSVTDLGQAIVTDFGPDITKAIGWMKDWIDTNKAFIEVKVREALDAIGTWVTTHQDDIKNFGEGLKTFATAAGSIAVAFSQQSPMMQSLELFGILIARVLGPVTALRTAMQLLGALTAPEWLLALLGVAAAKTMADNTIDPNRDWANESTGERIMRNLDEGAADRMYGHRGEQLVNGPHHGIGVHANTDRRNLWQKTMPKWLGGQEAPASGRALHGGQQKANAAAITDELNKAGLPAEGIAAALGSMQTESSLNPAVPENSYNHGHHGLIQWDSQRWPKVESWIKSQGGDPWDVRWQARAFVAEGRAKPGDALYNGPMTARGFSALENSGGDVNRAIGGMRDIERFGVGEEGGRGALARSLLPGVQAQLAAPPAPVVPSGTIGDAANLAAEQRRAAGRATPGDAALMAEYHRQQATPVSRAPTASALPHPVSHTYDSAANSLFRAYHESKHRDPNKPVTVELTDQSAAKVHGFGHPSLDARARGAVDAKHASWMRSQSYNGVPNARHFVGMASHVAALQAEARYATINHHVDNSSDTQIGSITVNTSATDAKGIASDLGPHLRQGRIAAQKNTGLA